MTAKEQQTEPVKKYYYALGRRKTSVAKVRLFPEKNAQAIEEEDKEKALKKGDFNIEVNGKDYKDYFKGMDHEYLVTQPLKAVNYLGDFGFKVFVKGGGIASQAGAVKHGIAKSLVVFNEIFKPQLKSLGLLKRDPRMVERKKAGFKKARRSKQWSKR